MDYVVKVLERSTYFVQIVGNTRWNDGSYWLVWLDQYSRLSNLLSLTISCYLLCIVRSGQFSWEKKHHQIDISHANNHKSPFIGSIKNDRKFWTIPPFNHGGPDMKCTYFHRNCWKSLKWYVACHGYLNKHHIYIKQAQRRAAADRSRHKRYRRIQ